MKHPSAALLQRHATGDLPHPAWIAVDAHVETCGICAAVTSAAEEAEGLRLAETAPIDLAPDVLDRLLASLTEQTAPKSATRKRIGDVELPRAVAEAGVGKRRWLTPGFWAAFVDAPDADDWRAFVLRTPPGAVVPSHRHNGPELIAVLAGELTDGRRYKAGDFAEIGQDDEHALRAGRNEPCVCLIAVQGRFRWTGPARILSPILGV